MILAILLGISLVSAELVTLSFPSIAVGTSYVVSHVAPSAALSTGATGVAGATSTAAAVKGAGALAPAVVPSLKGLCFTPKGFMVCAVIVAGVYISNPMVLAYIREDKYACCSSTDCKIANGWIDFCPMFIYSQYSVPSVFMFADKTIVAYTQYNTRVVVKIKNLSFVRQEFTNTRGEEMMLKLQQGGSTNPLGSAIDKIVDQSVRYSIGMIKLEETDTHFGHFLVRAIDNSMQDGDLPYARFGNIDLTIS